MEAEGQKGAAVDSEIVWQTLRAQVAKVEWQPDSLFRYSPTTITVGTIIGRRR